MIERILSIPSVTKYRKEILSEVKGNILEIGFGTDLNLPCYSKDVREITVLDTNEEMSSLAKKRIQQSQINVRFKLLSAEVLPFEDEPFDTIVSTFTFCSIENIDSAMNEFYRILKPDGAFI
jgi:ubiquinone/menaquinone biosynthesis C-methylase UbiE